MPPLVLALGVLCWVAGFDMIYALQDVDIDRKEGLCSMVVWLGASKAVTLVGCLHAFLLVSLIGFGLLMQQNIYYYLFLIPMPFLLWYEHRIATMKRLDLINRAFFQTNILVGFLFVLATVTAAI